MPKEILNIHKKWLADSEDYDPNYSEEEQKEMDDFIDELLAEPDEDE